MRRFSRDELMAFAGRADSKEKVLIAIRFIEKMGNISIELFDELMDVLECKYREYVLDERADAMEYSAACPWNAPGMRARDFC